MFILHMSFAGRHMDSGEAQLSGRKGRCLRLYGHPVSTQEVVSEPWVCQRLPPATTLPPLQGAEL